MLYQHQDLRISVLRFRVRLFLPVQLPYVRYHPIRILAPHERASAEAYQAPMSRTQSVQCSLGIWLGNPGFFCFWGRFLPVCLISNISLFKCLFLSIYTYRVSFSQNTAPYIAPYIAPCIARIDVTDVDIQFHSKIYTLTLPSRIIHAPFSLSLSMCMCMCTIVSLFKWLFLSRFPYRDSFSKTQPHT